MIIDTLLASAERDGSHATVADPTREMSYGRLARFAGVMRRHVLKATDAPHVGLLMPSTCAFAGTFYGILWARRIAVPLNFLLQTAELAAVVEDAELDVVLTIRFFRDLAETLPCRVIFLEDLPLKRDMVLQVFRRHPLAPEVTDDDTAVLLYTSGTSGMPKGVCQTYRNLRFNVDAAIEKAQLKGEHRFLGLLPLFHSFGLTTMLLVPTRLGASVYYLPRFQPAAVLEAVRARKISVTMMIASMYAALLRSKKGGCDDLASLEYAVAGGEALPDSVYEAVRERFGVEIIQGYGMSEAAP
ncbi:MAG: AMP-binding protein, partial [Phycisphaerae bacterium]